MSPAQQQRMHALYGGAVQLAATGAAATPNPLSAVPFILPATPVTGQGRWRRGNEVETSGDTPKAKRPDVRPEAGVPVVTAMDIAEVTQFSHNLLGQFQAEQIFTTGIASVVHSHAVDLD